ncbi:hypothetical protein KP509_23G013400 [Ceratopteris richardii]|nr:hypothetical protein KP509_23G013400 [Ceratopteris richardii]
MHVWSSIISANTRLGQSAHAIKLYCRMQETHADPDNHVLISTIRACADDERFFNHGKLVHHRVLELSLESDAYISSSLIAFYAKSGALEDSYGVFHRLKNPDTVTWGVIINAFSQHGHGKDALYLFRSMQGMGVYMDEVIFLSVLKACCNIRDSEQTMRLHTYVVKSGLEVGGSLGNALVDAYAKCGSIEEAHYVFIILPRRDLIAWGAIIDGYVQHGFHEVALFLFQEMYINIEPDPVIAMSCLKACSYYSVSSYGKLMHFYIVSKKFESNLHVVCAAVDMYGKCGTIEDAYATFREIHSHNIVTYNAMLSAYVQHGYPDDAACLFQEMLQEHIIPNDVTFVCILKLCSSMVNLQLGNIMHSYIVENSPKIGDLVVNTLTDMYARCGSITDAFQVFGGSSKRDVVTWIVLILGLVQHGKFDEGSKYFWQMLSEGTEADEAAFLSALKACTGGGDLHMGRLVHMQVVMMNNEYDVLIGNTLIDFYGKCGSFEDTWAVFVNLKKHDKATYNAMIGACVQYNQPHKALYLFGKMVGTGISPSEVTLACAISACTDTVAIDYGKLVHNLYVEIAIEDNLYITNALVCMYGKCGSPESALSVFNYSSTRDIVTWNSIIAAFAQHSLYSDAMSFFEKMQRAGIEPDEVTFLLLLSACAHSGLIEEGCSLFKSMKRDFRLTPTADHHNCMLDLLGRAGCMIEAADFSDSTPCKASTEGQTSLLSHCKEKGIVDLGHSYFNQLTKLDHINAIDFACTSHDNFATAIPNCFFEELRYDEVKNFKKYLAQEGQNEISYQTYI